MKVRGRQRPRLSAKNPGFLLFRERFLFIYLFILLISKRSNQEEGGSAGETVCPAALLRVPSSCRRASRGAAGQTERRPLRIVASTRTTRHALPPTLQKPAKFFFFSFSLLPNGGTVI